MVRITETVVASNEIDSVLQYLNNIDTMVADRCGIILQTDENFESYYGCKKESVLGRSVYELEEEGLFRPSSIAKVLRVKKEVTLVQNLKSGKRLIVTAVPIKNENDEIIRVVAYSTDVEQYLHLKEWSEDLHEKIEQYNSKINELENKQRLMEEVLHNNPIFDNKNNAIKEDNKEDIMGSVITKNKNFTNSLNKIKKMSKYDVNILFQGETGVGKTMLAKKLHMLSGYSEGEFIEVNCGAIPKQLIESELFGYTKGSFTGANNDGKKGLIELAHKGSLFLDEVGELPMSAQVKLLKVIQDKTVRRIGSTVSKKIDCRIIAATNKNLEEEVQQGKFRADLLYRLNTISIDLPPLRKRKDDIPLLSINLLKKYNEKYGENKMIDDSVMEYLNNYTWPGNIRELENVIQGLILNCEEEMIKVDILPQYIINTWQTQLKNKIEEENSNTNIGDLNKAIEALEGKIIKEYYKKYNSSIKLSKALNISQTTAVRKINKYLK
ncbi:sigma-54 interaction domain-containing protein [Romboutsia sp.]|uniref:sigma-54 interaction domain-containing protein n=1 Tax=Romboutsia sp. TaxID=1965302 RepID=UPI003F382F38